LGSAISRVDTIGIPSSDTARSREFDGETVGSRVCHMADFSDPDGNQLTLHGRWAPYVEAADG
jgi:hypothetical protein